MDVLVSNAVLVEGLSNRNKMDFNLPVYVLTVRLNSFRFPVTVHREQSMKREKPTRCNN